MSSTAWDGLSISVSLARPAARRHGHAPGANPARGVASEFPAQGVASEFPAHGFRSQDWSQRSVPVRRAALEFDHSEFDHSRGGAVVTFGVEGGGADVGSDRLVRQVSQGGSRRAALSGDTTLTVLQMSDAPSIGERSTVRLSYGTHGHIPLPIECGCSISGHGMQYVGVPYHVTLCGCSISCHVVQYAPAIGERSTVRLSYGKHHFIPVPIEVWRSI